MRFNPLLVATLAALILGEAAIAQRFSEGYTFLKAVRERDGAKVTEILNQPGQTIVNTRDDDSGEGALHIVIKLGDETYMRFLLARNANPNLQDRRGNTPLMLAVEKGLVEAVALLRRYNANVNLANASGETPLIRAVQLRNLEMVQALLAAGADPDQSDSLAGMSARDYARRDTRSPAIGRLLADAPRVQRSATTGPQL